jgi:hypothetical protein
VGTVFSPLDQELELLPGDYTPQVHEWIVRLSSWMPFGAAAEIATALLGVKVSKSSAVRAAEAAGAAYVAVQTEAMAVLEAQALSAPVGGERMLVSADGAMVPLLHGEWGEVRTLALGVIKPDNRCRRRRKAAHGSGDVNEPAAPPVRTVDISYFSRFTTAETFTHLALVETHHRGLENARQVVAVMDGADWLQQLVDYHCPKAVRILDYAHAAQHVAATAQALWGQASEQAATWTRQWTGSLLAQGPELLLAELRRLQAAYPTDATLSQTLAYLEKRQPQLNYPYFRQQGWPIGSGMVESANKLVVEARLKGAGMHWQRSHVDAMLGLRNIVCNKRWPQEWPKIKHRLITEAQQRHMTPCRQRLQTLLDQEQQALLATQRTEYAALHPEWSAEPAAQPPPPTPKTAKPAHNHPWRRSPVGKARFQQNPKT